MVLNMRGPASRWLNPVEHHGHRAYRNGLCTGNGGGATSTGSPLAALTRNEPRSQRRSGKCVAKKDLDNPTFRLARCRESCHRKDDWLNIGDDPYLSQAMIRMAMRGESSFGNGKACLELACLELERPAWNSQGLPEVGKACLELARPAWSWKGLPGIGKACLEAARLAWSWQEILREGLDNKLPSENTAQSQECEHHRLNPPSCGVIQVFPRDGMENHLNGSRSSQK
jgi:hypothetical protein